MGLRFLHHLRRLRAIEVLEAATGSLERAVAIYYEQGTPDGDRVEVEVDREKVKGGREEVERGRREVEGEIRENHVGTRKRESRDVEEP